ncbi:hypothetical protein D0962_09550 [Leptolyngbyaceae cyanobacterium CCMR0082]|uniref:Uncharacterized protein n=1 Tax=Adonisia turfae CCMR0082 TaxID=2304604 RepID=A0A6M0S4M8_9CYAN|nr:hypothetical protein [Adonisia turfae CCMR0082]
MLQRRFKNLKTNKHRNLWFDPATGQAWLLGQWWDVGFLKENYSIVEDPIVQSLGPRQSPGFAPGVESASKFQATFRPRRRRK